MRKFITYQQMAEYFDPPPTQHTIYNWLRVARIKVFQTPMVRGRAGRFERGNKTMRVRRSEWEKFLRVNEKPIQSKK